MDKKEIIDQIEKTQEAVKQAKIQYYLTHFYEFNRDVLKWPDIYEPLHRQVCNFVQDNVNKKKLLILLPRGSFKSSIVTVGYTLWRIAQNPNERILIANATYPMACQFLSQVKDHLEKNETFIDLFGNLATMADSWRENRITVAREKSYEQKDPTVSAFGADTNVVGSHYNMALLDDMVNDKNITTREQIEKVINFYKGTLDLVDSKAGGHKQVIIIGCFVSGTKVLMANGGWKNIEDINAGEMVKTRKGNKVVTANVSQGVSEVYELRTNNSKIIGTKNHPFLRNNIWVKMEELKKGDKISFYHYKKDGKNEISEELSWALGYMVGDGWVTLHPNQKGSLRYVVGIAMGVYDDRNHKIKDIFEKNFGCKFLCKNGNWVTTSAELGRWLLEHGLERGAHNKKVPSFIFEQNPEIRKQFIQGFLDADGWEIKKEKSGHHVWKSRVGTRTFAYEVSSKELAEGIRRLAIITGLRVNNISSRERFIKAPHSKYEILSNTHHCYIYFDKNKPKEIEETFVRSIKKIGEQEVYDLSVEGEHSFIAEGFVVHNTTWHYSDLYAWIQDKENNILDDFKVLKMPAYEGEWGQGKLLFPARLSWDVLDGLKRQQGSSHFAAQYMLDPILAEDAVFKFDFKYYEKTDLTGVDLNRFITVDPAISEKKEADYSAMVCVGVDKMNNWYILDLWREKCQPKRLLDQLFYWDSKWKPISVGIETTAFQKTLQYFAYEEMKKQNHFIPLKELTHSDKTKDQRIRGLEPRYETGSVFHCKQVANNDYLEDEIRRFPKGKNDDMVDALASQLELTFPPKFKERRNFKLKRSIYPA
jgi:intein/homing endonuclease/phage terminase large subunit-like protein